MDTIDLPKILLFIQHTISFCGVIIILFGVLIALFSYVSYLFKKENNSSTVGINQIRLKLGRVLILGLEFIIAADLIGTTTAPDYYSVGILASIVLIRTVLSYTINREIDLLTRNEATKSGLKH